MATDYKIRIYNTSGVLQYELVDFQSLAYNDAVNFPGTGKVVLRGTHPVVDDIEDKWQVEIWRRNRQQAINWYADFYGLFREPDRQGVDPGRFEMEIVGQKEQLNWRIVAWSAGTANRSTFNGVAAETIMKTLVDYNAAGNATVANGREREGAITGISIETDGGNGNTLDWSCAWKPLLPELQRIACIGGGDFDLVKTATTTWEFRWYTGQLGTDRTASVLFATGLGNMGNPRLRQRRRQEKTVAIVGGQGEGSDRDIQIRTGTNYNATTNNIEMFVDARDIAKGSTAALDDRGDSALDQVEAFDDFTFDALQTPATLYGKHYFLGDLVTARSPFTGNDITSKFEARAVAVDERGDETIRARFENV